MRALQCIFFFFTLTFITNCSNTDNQESTQDSTPLSYKEILNVSYGSSNEQVYDIYLPENRSLDTKVIILVHGGGWSSGDKSDMNGFKDSFKQDLPEYAIVNINYRLSDENNKPYPMQTNDITAVINHLKTNKNEYVISENYGFIGVSAGGHLSLLWSYALDSEKNVGMVASIVGPTNFTDPAYLNNEDPELQEMIDLFGINPTTSYLEEASPYHQASIKSPPTVLFYGGQDPLIPTTQGTALDEKLTELNVIHEFTLYPEEGHGWIGVNLLDTWTKLKSFTQDHL